MKGWSERNKGAGYSTQKVELARKKERKNGEIKARRGCRMARGIDKVKEDCRGGWTTQALCFCCYLPAQERKRKEGKTDQCNDGPIFGVRTMASLFPSSVL